MSNSYYVYNNEAISALVIKKYFEYSKSIDISRLFVILPILLDDNLVEILLSEHFDNIESLIDKYPSLFSSFNVKYLELIPITINSFTLLKEMNDVIIKNGIISCVEGGLVNFNESSIGDRIIKIFFSISPFIELTNKYDTSSLYKILKIRL
jgi:hypothetical protein